MTLDEFEYLTFFTQWCTHAAYTSFETIITINFINLQQLSVSVVIKRNYALVGVSTFFKI